MNVLSALDSFRFTSYTTSFKVNLIKHHHHLRICNQSPPPPSTCSRYCIVDFERTRRAEDKDNSKSGSTFVINALETENEDIVERKS